MSTSKDFRDFILEQLRLCEEITCRPMMGEYLLYSNGTLFGGIYDERLLFKVCPNNEKFGMRKEIPYKGAKPMFMFEEFDNLTLLRDIVVATCDGMKK